MTLKSLTVLVPAATREALRTKSFESRTSQSQIVTKALMDYFRNNMEQKGKHDTNAQ